MYCVIKKVPFAFLLSAGFLCQMAIAEEQGSFGDEEAEKVDKPGFVTGSKNAAADEESTSEDNEEPECD